MSAMKSMIMYAIDNGNSMKQYINENSTISNNSNNSNNPTKSQLALTLLVHHMTQKMLVSKTVEFGCIVYGDSQTKNELNSLPTGGYDDLYEIMDMNKPNLFSIKQIINDLHHRPSSNKDNSDIVNGIILGQHILMTRNMKLKYNRILIVVTDGESCIDNDGVSDLETVLSQMKSFENNILHCVMIGKINQNSSIIKRENAKLLQSCCENTSGFYIEGDNINELLILLSYGAALSTRSQISKIILEVSKDLKFPCNTFNKIMKCKPPTLKRILKQDLSNQMTCNSIESIDINDISILKRDTIYRNPSDPDQEIEIHERVKGFRYGSQYIPINSDQEELFKLPSSPIIRIIGFITSNKIPRNFLLSSPTMIQGSLQLISAQLAITSFSRSLREKNVYAIARYVKKENADPTLVVLIPPSYDNGNLMMFRIPCEEDVRNYNFPSLKDLCNDEITIKKRKLMNEYVNTMTKSDITLNDLTPANPSYHSIIEYIYNTATGTSNQNTMNNVFTSLKTPYLSYGTNEQTIQIIEKFPENFHLVDKSTDIKQQKAKKSFWSEDIGIATNSNIDSSDSKLMGIKVSDQLENSIATSGVIDVVQKQEMPVFNDSAIEIDREFERVMHLIGAWDNIVEKKTFICNTMNQFIDIILSFVTKGFTNAFYNKAIKSIKVCVLKSENLPFFYLTFVDLKTCMHCEW